MSFLENIKNAKTRKTNGNYARTEGTSVKGVQLPSATVQSNGVEFGANQRNAVVITVREKFKARGKDKGTSKGLFIELMVRNAYMNKAIEYHGKYTETANPAGKGNPLKQYEYDMKKSFIIVQNDNEQLFLVEDTYTKGSSSNLWSAAKGKRTVSVGDIGARLYLYNTVIPVTDDSIFTTKAKKKDFIFEIGELVEFEGFKNDDGELISLGKYKGYALSELTLKELWALPSFKVNPANGVVITTEEVIEYVDAKEEVTNDVEEDVFEEEKEDDQF